MIDLRQERIDLAPEDVPFPEPSAHKRARGRFLIAFCAGVATTLLWQSYGDAARERIANLYPHLGWLAPRPAPTAQNPHVADVIALSSGSAVPPAEQPNAISFDFDVVGRTSGRSPPLSPLVESLHRTAPIKLLPAKSK
jgi:hypothetical protein